MAWQVVNPDGSLAGVANPNKGTVQALASLPQALTNPTVLAVCCSLRSPHNQKPVLVQRCLPCFRRQAVACESIPASKSFVMVQ